jgi:hypothetical protein
LSVHHADSIGGGHRQSIKACYGRDHVLASPGKDWMWCTFVVDGSGNDSGLSPCFGEVDGGGLLHPQHGLVSVQLSHLGIEGCLLTDKLIVVLSCPPLGIDLSGAVSLVAPPSKLVVDQGGALFLARVASSAP